jgi:hypothetical protein
VRGELEHAGAWRRDILSPSESAVELLCAFGIRDWDDDCFSFMSIVASPSSFTVVMLSPPLNTLIENDL